MNYEQQVKKLEKLKKMLETYRRTKDKISGIKELSEILGTGFSISTIQRYMHELYEKNMIDISEYKEILEWLKTNKEIGTSLGGKNSQTKHGYEKGEHGYFKGSKK